MEENKRESDEESLLIDPIENKYPYCVIWAPVPCMSWFFPCLGHTGICDSKGKTFDFGPFGEKVYVGEFAFKTPSRYLQLNEDRRISPEDWDRVIDENCKKFREKRFNIVSRNCHHFITSPLNDMNYFGNQISIVDLGRKIFFGGKFVKKSSYYRTFLPSVCWYSAFCGFCGCFFMFLFVLVAIIITL